MKGRKLRKCLAAAIAVMMLGTSVTGCGGKTGSAYVPTLPTGTEEADIWVDAVDGLSEDFIMGMDVSTVLAEEASGVVYYDENGNEADLFQILADAGINYIRVRVWNDPFDENGNGYGGGNNDVAAAAEIGRRAAEYGMKLAVDFHYSDFWADPGKQFAPKAWENMTLDEKSQALYDYTTESLKTISDAGADIGMVQIGNEINNGMAGETNYDNVITLLEQGSQAVRDFDEKGEIKIVVHYTNIESTDALMERADALAEAGLDYDVFGVSYYSYWHGSMENMQNVLETIQSDYGKETCIMETSYAYTLEDGDGCGNSVGETDLLADYTASVQSQANNIRDIIEKVSDAGSLGVFYWEGAWVPVGSDATTNSVLWEKYGSGWASSYSADYDPDDAGKYYGGNAWDNQALFDHEGKALPSLNVFRYVRYGATCDLAVDYVTEPTVEVNVGDEAVLPETVPVSYNDRSQSGEVAVTWDEAEVAAIDTTQVKDYTVNGSLDDGTQLSCLVKVANVNYVVNPSFEDEDVTMWIVTSETGTDPTDIQEKSTDAVTGDYSFHFWDEGAQEFKVEQTISGLSEGSYTFQTNLQGGDVGADAVIYSYAVIDGQIYQSAPVTLDGWCVWQTPEITDLVLDGTQDITVGVYVKAAGGGWGTMDDFYLYRN
ncbi:MAG: glycosyl hydrolase 53 family protein [Roseburia sp.]